MEISEFVKLPAKEANEKLRDALKRKALNVKQFKELSGEWLKDKGLIKTDAGWYTQEQLNEMGMFFDKDTGTWMLEGEPVSIDKKNGQGKIISIIDYLPVKAIAYDTKEAELKRAMRPKGQPLTPEMAESILTGMED